MDEIPGWAYEPSKVFRIKLKALDDVLALLVSKNLDGESRRDHIGSATNQIEIQFRALQRHKQDFDALAPLVCGFAPVLDQLDQLLRDWHAGLAAQERGLAEAPQLSQEQRASRVAKVFDDLKGVTEAVRHDLRVLHKELKVEPYARTAEMPAEDTIDQGELLRSNGDDHHPGPIVSLTEEDTDG